MYYNAATDRALQSLEQKAAETRRIIEKLNPPTPLDIVWSVNEGRWIKNPQLVSA